MPRRLISFRINDIAYLIGISAMVYAWWQHKWDWISLFAAISFLIAGIWELFTAFLLRRGYAGAGWGWGNPPVVEGWRGGLGAMLGLGYLMLWAHQLWVAGICITASFAFLVVGLRKRMARKAG